MNEHVKKLAADAKLHMVSEPRMQQLAELFAARCAEIVRQVRDEAIDGDWNVDEAMTIAAQKIEDEFSIDME